MGRRSHARPKANLYTVNLPDPIPTIPIPLGIDDDEPLLNVQHLVNDIYDRGGYALRIKSHSKTPIARQITD